MNLVIKVRSVRLIERMHRVSGSSEGPSFSVRFQNGPTKIPLSTSLLRRNTNLDVGNGPGHLGCTGPTPSVFNLGLHKSIRRRTETCNGNYELFFFFFVFLRTVYLDSSPFFYRKIWYWVIQTIVL